MSCKGKSAIEVFALMRKRKPRHRGQARGVLGMVRSVRYSRAEEEKEWTGRAVYVRAKEPAELEKHDGGSTKINTSTDTERRDTREKADTQAENLYMKGTLCAYLSPLIRNENRI